MYPLASIDDVEAVMGRPLTDVENARAEAVLVKASELFRRRSGQPFEAGTSTVRVRNRAGVITLPYRPVTAVSAIVDDSGATVPFEWTAGPQLALSSAERFLTVTFEHGGEIPDLVRMTIAEIAKKVLMISANAAAGMVSSMRVSGPFTDQESYATWAQGGQTMLAPADDQLALSYRIPILGPISNI